MTNYVSVFFIHLQIIVWIVQSRTYPSSRVPTVCLLTLATLLKKKTSLNGEFVGETRNCWKTDVANVNKKKVQLDATICRHLFTAESLYMFRASQHPSSGVLETVTATSGIGHNTGTATSFQRGRLRTFFY